MSFEDFFPENSKEIYGVSKALIAESLHERGLSKMANNLLECYTHGYRYKCGCCGIEYFVPISCDVRLCPDCGPKNTVHYLNQILPKVESLRESAPDGFRLRIIEMGLPIFSDLNPQHISDIRVYFNRLRNRRRWKECFPEDLAGGLYVIETKYRIAGDSYFDKYKKTWVTYKETGWNVHIHAVILSRYLDQGLFKKMWYISTYGKANIVFIKEIKKTRFALEESVGYCFEPMRFRHDGGLLSDKQVADKYAEYIGIWHGKMRYRTFGNFHGFVKKDKKVSFELFCPYHLDEPLYYEGGVSRDGARDIYDSFMPPRETLDYVNHDWKYRKPAYKEK